MAVNGVSENAAIIPEIWSADWYPELRANLPMANFFDKTPEHIGELRFGDILHMSQFAKATGETLTDDKQNFTTEEATISDKTITINKRAHAGFEFSDLAQLQSKSFENAAREALMYSIAKQVEDAVTSAISPSASAPVHVIQTASAGVLAAADVLNMRNLLSIQSVPNTERALFLAPSFYGDLLGASTFISNDNVNKGAVASANFSYPLYGFDVVEGQNIASDTGYAVHRSAIYLIMQQGLRLKVSDQHPNKKYGYIMTADLVFGVSQFDDERSVKITASS
jgi:hypothetical protein